jgi:N-acetylglucosaminyl-diphospho-decaprenol L-rhamnosyltransferase
MSDVSLSVLIVSYNARDHLPACLSALAAQTLPRDQFEVVLLDNASADGSADLAEQFSGVTVVRSARNLGFAEGNNRAGSHARGRYWVLLNPDTIPDPFWLEEVTRAIGENPGCAIACKLVLADDPAKLNSAGLFLLRDGRGADRGFRQPDDGRYEGGGEVFGGCAAALAVPAPAAGERLFDPRLFLYCEDLEWAWRWRRAGRRVVFCPRAVVRHAVGAGDSATHTFFAERNRALVCLRWGDPVTAVLAGAGLLVRAGRAVVFALLRRPKGRHWRATVRAAVDYLRRMPGVLAERQS